MKGIQILFLLFCINFVGGQNIPKTFDNESTWQTFKYDMGSVFKGIGHFVTRPLHWKGKQWLNFAGVATGTTLLTFVDDEFDHWAYNFRDDVSKDVLTFRGDYARPEGNYGLTGAVYFTGLFTKNEKLRRTGVLIMASTITGGFLQQLTIRVIGRARPLTGKSADSFDPFSI